MDRREEIMSSWFKIQAKKMEKELIKKRKQKKKRKRKTKFKRKGNFREENKRKRSFSKMDGRKR